MSKELDAALGRFCAAMRGLEEMRSSSEEQVKAVNSLAGVYERILRIEREQNEKREGNNDG